MSEDDARFTIDQVDPSEPMEAWKPRLADYGKRRHLSYCLDFDTRAHLLKEEPGPLWTPETVELHRQNQQHIRDSLAREFGEDHIEAKITNFIDVGSKPFSIIAYHNGLNDQVRRAFIVGSYYPALVGACALGERTLNHLVLDLREHYRHTPEYKKIYRKDSLDDWRVAIDTLEAWGVLLPKAVDEFRALAALRNRSIHFNPSTYQNLRADALAAVLHIGAIIGEQFSSWGQQPWFIMGTLGHIFIKREWEAHPFIRTFYLRNCPLVGPHFSISFEGGLTYFDHNDYGGGEWSDEEFTHAFNNRDLNQLAGPPPGAADEEE
jgi:hypothetical protein